MGNEPAAAAHWAFRAPEAAAPPPETQHGAWIVDAIDRFVAARLDAVGVLPSRPAERSVFLRRASYDLLGLPPTLKELDHFINDRSPDAEARLLDRLLASPRYGERWARHWLDVARYADNKGYVFFERKEFPWAFTYRDYVIGAFNSDLPFDRFVLEQLAADQLGDPGARDSHDPALAAMGFLTVGGRFMNNTHDVIDDRIDVTTRGLMGLTVTCARCHDHKYDPISQSDYYALYGVFRSSEEPVVPPALRAPRTDAERRFAAEMAKREKALRDFVTRKHAELVKGTRMRAGEYLSAVYARRGQPVVADFMLLVPKGGINPAAVLRWQEYVERWSDSHHPVWTPWHRLAALPREGFAERAAAVIQTLRRARSTSTSASTSASTSTSLVINQRVLEALTATPVRSMEDVAKRYGKLLVSVAEGWQRRLAAAPTEPPARFDDPADEELRQVLFGAESPANIPLVLDWGFLTLFPDRHTQGEFKKLLGALEKWSVEGPDAPARAMVLADSATLYEPRVFLRGNPRRLGEPVARRFLRLLSPDAEPFRHGSGRLELARAIADVRNPLTARVFVNRIWQHHFGVGLVATPNDFGIRGAPPSHPRLLDFLAATFVEGGWSTKRLHRRIMLSATYRQRSLDRDDGVQKDPENRWLWRMARHRLDFESMRDGLLAVAGELDTRMGGRAARLSAGPGGYSRRRSIYGFINRMDVDPLLTTFDFPNPAASCGRRAATTVAPQALYFMNHRFLAAMAQRIASRLDGSVTLEERVRYLYRRLISRSPAAAELEMARTYLGGSASTERWRHYVHVLLMTNEFLFVE